MSSKKQLRKIYAQLKRCCIQKLSNSYHYPLKAHLEYLILQKINKTDQMEQKTHQNVLTICSYIPKVNQEIIPPFLNENQLMQKSKRLVKLFYGYPYFTKISREMQFKLFDSNEKKNWQKHLFEVKLPPQSAQSIYPDILLVPLMCFDQSLNRIGYGGGYYDNYIRKLRLNKSRKTLCVGIGLQCLKLVDKVITTELHDQPLDCIITEAFILFKK